MRTIKLCLLATMSIVTLCNTSYANCTSSGFGISIGASLMKPTYKIKIKREVGKTAYYELLKAALQAELKNSGVPEITKSIAFINGDDDLDLENKAPNTYTKIFTPMLKDANINKLYPNISGNNIGNNTLIIKDNGDYYIKPLNTSDEKDYVSVSDILDNYSLIDDTIKLNKDSVSKFCMAADLGIFYNIKVLDWLVRPELTVSLPFVNRTINFNDSTTNKSESNQQNNQKKSDKDGLNITRSFDVQLKLLGGYHITEKFKMLFGVGTVYHRYKIQATLNSWSANQAEEVKKLVSNVYNTLKAKYDMENSLGKWNIVGIIGFEFNINPKNIITIDASVEPSTSIMNAKDAKSWGDLTMSNNWKVGVSYKHIF